MMRQNRLCVQIRLIIKDTMKNIFLSLLAAVLLASCQISFTDITEQKYDDDPMEIKLALDMATKVTDQSYDYGDVVGLYVVNHPHSLVTSGNHYDNVPYEYWGNWEAPYKMFWLDGTTPADFYCYYPYSEVNNIEEHEFSVQKHQTSYEAFIASDFTWGKVENVLPTDDVVEIPTRHLFSRVRIMVELGGGFTENEYMYYNFDVNLCNVKQHAKINLQTGEVTAIGEPSELIPWFTWQDEYRKAIILPQTVPDGSDLVAVRVDGKEFVLKKGVTFESGKSYTITIRLNKTSAGVNIGIEDWDDHEGDFGGVAEIL